MKRHHLLFSTCAMSLMVGGAFAQDLDGKGDEVEQLVVTATRAPVRLDQVGQSITVLDERAIQTTQTTTVTDLLVQTPGVTSSRNGGVGKSTSLNIRGAESDQTVVLFDGVKINDPSSTGGGYNSADLLSGDVARIEVLRGAQSTLWGSQAIGGVVNIITKKPTEPLEATVAAEGGEFHTYYVRGGLGGRSERLMWRFGAGYYTTEGISAYAEGTEPDGYSNIALNGRAVFDITEAISVDARAVYVDSYNEFDATAADNGNTGDSTQLLYYIGLTADLMDGRFKNRIAYAHTDVTRLNYNPLQANTTLTFDAEGKNARWEYQGNFQINDHWNAVFGAEKENSEMRTQSPTAARPNPPVARGEVGIDGFYGQLQGEIVAGLTLTGGLRHDSHQTFGDHTLGQAAAAWSLNEGRTVFRTSYGEGFKAPSLYQLRSEYGNFDLAPEEAESWDIGFEHRLTDNFSVSAAYFNRDTLNQIEFVSCTAVNRNDPNCVGRTGFYENVGVVATDGVEAGVGVNVGRFTGSANYTHIEAINETPGSPNNGKTLARRPTDTYNATLSYVWPIRLTTSASFRYVSDSWNNAANSQHLPSYTVTDIRASYQLNDTVEVFGRVENLFDRIYQTTRNYGSPGRAAYAGLRARF